MMADLVGTSLGPYMITERIGRGGMADVYKAFHTGLSVYRAVKVIRTEFVASDDFRARFQKEARAVAQLRHPNIVQVHDFGMHGDTYYMVMEFIEGQDLKKVLLAEGSIQPINRAVDLVLQVAGALEYAHGQGLIHRDVKPENVMLTASGLPILTDFGIAKLATSGTQLTQTGLGIGTPAYMSPEQAQGLSDVGPEADIYALSVVLFELLTGRVPFSADTPVAVILKAIKDPLPMPRALNPQISEALQAVIIKGTAKLPTDRYATAGQLRLALERALSESSARDINATRVRRDPTDVRDDTTPSAARGPGVWFAGAVAGLVLAAGSYFWLTRQVPTRVDEPASSAAVTDQPAVETRAAMTPAAIPSVIDAGTLSFDRPITGRTGHAGQRVDFAFDGVAGESVYFDQGRGTGETRFALFAPDGASVFETTSDDGPRRLPQGGRYRLSAEPQSDGPAEFEFSLWRLVQPVLDGGKIGTNVLVEGHTDIPGQVEHFTIDGKAGQQMTFALDQASEMTDFRLVDSNGREIFATDGDAGPVKLSRSSSYTLVADPRFDKPSRFAFMLRSPVQGRSSVETVAQPGHDAAKPARVIATRPSDPTEAAPPDISPAPAAMAVGGGGLNQVTKGVTTQSDLLRLFGGPNLTTVDPQGRDTWVYERTVTQTDSRTATAAASGGVDFSAFWSVGQASVNASKSESATTLSSGSSIHTVTVIVTFAPNRTVLDYTIKANYF